MIQPYLCFEGRSEEAIEFYKKALGAQVEMLMRFKDSPVPCGSGEHMTAIAEKVMHATLRIGDATLMCSDGGCAGTSTFGGISLSFDVPSEAKAKEVVAALSEDGQVKMPVTKTFFSPAFGMVTDKFGVSWMVIVPQKM
ncbi:MAG: VOC family protein [Planctomycetes bacterium]|nr:VOC family protein [Planctomycetota bacterium]